MKKLSPRFIFSFLSLVLFAASLQAQTISADYFVGTWNVKAFGLPDGDKDLIIQFEKKDGKLSGGFVDPATKKVINPFTRVDLASNKLTANFIAPEQQMDVYLTLEKKDDTNVTGSIMDMFHMEGTKAK
ncbi:hypothetical protein [Adhaeribacter pallidiroseus]|uniref:Lipocalin-like domain-containing protein n=1 Tax=Adhaeribacter pallidiroseus TaxID=2072847 RepID=A0A369QSR7_9BACT|nr:hypothetical protein [Adhaeribacter pallidiroseus]RDC66257.1 hypothetical protein AHMF7616_04888 [Adhaeribacter pallidiroseus]